MDYHQRKYNAIVDDRAVPRLQIPALTHISDSLREGKPTNGLNTWMVSGVGAVVRWPTMMPLSQNSVLLPTSSGFIVYEPNEGDANYRDPAYDPKAKVDFTKRRELLAGKPRYKVLGKETTLALLELYARAFSEFDAVMTELLEFKDEMALAKKYGGCEIFGTVRIARAMLAASCLLRERGTPLDERFRVFLKYSANSVTSYFTIRYLNQGLVLGKEPGSTLYALAVTARESFVTGQYEGLEYVTNWISISQGYVEVRDGLGMRVGGPVQRAAMPDHLTDLFQAAKTGSMESGAGRASENTASCASLRARIAAKIASDEMY